MFDMRGRKMPKHNPSVVKKDKEASQRFTHQAKHFWGRIPEEIRRALLDNVWCGKCGVTTIAHFRGTIEGGDLLLRGFCSRCGAEVARHIESR